MINIIGKPPINPFIFATSKLAVGLVFGGFVTQFFYNLRLINVPQTLEIVTIAIFCLGLILTLLSLLHLGGSTRFGLPKEETKLKTSGLYKYSRNPMYLGVGIMVLASVLFTLNPIIATLAIYGAIIHHKIVLKEEAFLKNRFGKQYKEYCQKVNRY